MAVVPQKSLIPSWSPEPTLPLVLGATPPLSPGSGSPPVRSTDGNDRVPEAAADIRTMMIPTILIADDEAGIRFPIAHILRGRGFRVLESENGREAVTLATSERPDLIVMDITMPQMSGVEAARLIRSCPEIDGTLIVAHSGEAFSVAERKALLELFDSHLRKPTNPDRLVREIGALLNDRQRDRSVT